MSNDIRGINEFWDSSNNKIIQSDGGVLKDGSGVAFSKEGHTHDSTDIVAGARLTSEIINAGQDTLFRIVD